MNDTIHQRITPLLSLVNPACKVETIHPETRLLDGGILDSLQIVSLIGEIETVFGCRIPLDDIVPENFETTQSIALMIQKNLTSGEQSASN